MKEPKTVISMTFSFALPSSLLKVPIDGEEDETAGSSGATTDREDEGSEECSPADTSGSSTDTEPNNKRKGKVSVSNIPKLVDNKRKHMEKSLSQAQRDHLLMSTAKEDIHLKKDMLDAFERSNKTLDESISKMTTCLSSLGEGIASGMRMLAMALANPPANPSPTVHYPPQYNYGRFSSSLPMTQEPSYENRDAFPTSHFNRFASGQEGENSRPSASGPIVSASQTLYEGNIDQGYYY